MFCRPWERLWKWCATGLGASVTSSRLALCVHASQCRWPPLPVYWWHVGFYWGSRWKFRAIWNCSSRFGNQRLNQPQFVQCPRRYSGVCVAMPWCGRRMPCIRYRRGCWMRGSRRWLRQGSWRCSILRLEYRRGSPEGTWVSKIPSEGHLSYQNPQRNLGYPFPLQTGDGGQYQQRGNYNHRRIQYIASGPGPRPWTGGTRLTIPPEGNWVKINPRLAGLYWVNRTRKENNIRINNSTTSSSPVVLVAGPGPDGKLVIKPPEGNWIIVNPRMAGLHWKQIRKLEKKKKKKHSCRKDWIQRLNYINNRNIRTSGSSAQRRPRDIQSNELTIKLCFLTKLKPEMELKIWRQRKAKGGNWKGKEKGKGGIGNHGSEITQESGERERDGKETGKTDLFE